MIEKYIVRPHAEQLLWDVLAGKRVTLIGGSKLFDAEATFDCHYVVHANWHNLCMAGIPAASAVYLESTEKVGLPISPVWIGVRLGADNEEHYRYWAKQRGVIVAGWDFATYENLNPYGHMYEWCNVLSKKLGTMPFTGVVAITHLLRFPIAQLRVTGMDLFASGGSDRRQCHYVDKVQWEWYRDNHAIGPQLRYLKELAQTDARFKPDQTLTDVLKGDWGYEEVVARREPAAKGV